MGIGVGSVPLFDSYVTSVEEMASAALSSVSSSRLDLLLPDVLDGQASTRLRETVPIQVRKEYGAYFSNSDLRAVALAPWTRGIEPLGPVLDPAVGAGDLLIEVARHFPIEEDLTQTLRQWESLLHGRDVEPAFVRLAKARLVLLAVSQGATRHKDTSIQLNDVLPGISVGDGLDLLNNGWSDGHIVMNPPFIYRRAPEDAVWASGRTSLAALFLAKVVEHARPGTHITAILPDVIRTGSRYDRLRSLVMAHLDMLEVEQYGRFDTWTDIDVFILRGVIRNGTSGVSPVQWWRRAPNDVLGDRFDVSVGPVVPHRDPESLPMHPFLRARAIPLGEDFDLSRAEQRGFEARLFRTPFVVVRRTSRPGDRSRGLGTMICGTGEALVENHLIVLKPKDGSVESCRHVIDLLASPLAKQWLDERIRCRHLTVQALRETPWFES